MWCSFCDGGFKFNQNRIEFSALAAEPREAGVYLRYGGAVASSGHGASPPLRLEPGETLELGSTRYQIVQGDYRKAYYAFRRFLDENGCRFHRLESA